MHLKELITHLETIAPPVFQESYDNAGLLTGNPNMKITGVLVCLDAIEPIIEEAIEKGCNVVVAHHPIVFKGLKQITGRNYVERVIIKAIKADIAIYAIHTNLDNVLEKGVNGKIAQKLGLIETQILAPKRNLQKVSALIPSSQMPECQAALFDAGITEVFSHTVQFEELGFDPTTLVKGAYIRLNAVITAAEQGRALSILKQYSDLNGISCQLVGVNNANPVVGSGLLGRLGKPMKENDFLGYLKDKMQTACIRHTKLLGENIERVAICGGAGSFLLRRALQEKADIFITGDYKYHEFFDADGKIVIADIGHFESEQFTIELLFEIISEKFSNFAVHSTEVNTNPVRYFVG